jgi:hypothetical protein
MLGWFVYVLGCVNLGFGVFCVWLLFGLGMVLSLVRLGLNFFGLVWVFVLGCVVLGWVRLRWVWLDWVGSGLVVLGQVESVRVRVRFV